MNTSKFIGKTILYVCFIVLVFVLFVERIETGLKIIHHEFVTKNFAEDASVFIPGNLIYGIHRPELPYHFGMTYHIEEELDMKFSIISYYQAWGGKDEHKFSTEIAKNLVRGGYIPMITWEPWLSAFEEYLGKEPDSATFIIASGKFDHFVREYARACVRFGKKMFLRPFHEMTNPWYSWACRYGNTPESFIKAWRHVYRIFQEEGARNVMFVWNPFMYSDTLFYPGDDYVDWIGLNIFNYGTAVPGGIWLDFRTVTRHFYDRVSQFNKPIIIGEAGSLDAGGNKKEWYSDMLRSLKIGEFPLIKAIVFFDTPVSRTPQGNPADLGFSNVEGIFGEMEKYIVRSK